MNAVLAWLGRKRVIGRRRFDWVAQSNDLGADRKPKNVALRAQLEPIRRRIAPSISIGSVETLRIELTDPQGPRFSLVTKRPFAYDITIDITTTGARTQLLHNSDSTHADS